MKKSFTEAQTAFALRQAASGIPVSEVTTKVGIADVTFHRRRKRYANLGIAGKGSSSGLPFLRDCTGRCRPQIGQANLRANDAGEARGPLSDPDYTNRSIRVACLGPDNQ